MNDIIWRELKDKRYSLASYCGIALALLLVYVSIFPSIKDSMAQFQVIYESYPKGLYQALGIENLSINKIENYLAIEMYSIVWPMLAILFSASLAGYTIAGQIERGIIGFYLALPISRTKLFVSKYGGGLVSIIIFTVASVLSTVPLAALFQNPMAVSGVIKLSLLSLLFMWAMYAASLFLSAWFSERSKVYMVMGGVLIVMYVANIIAGLKTSYEWLSHYSVFHYYNAQDLLSGGELHLSSVLVFVGMIVSFSVLGLVTFSRRDVSV